MIVRLAFCVDVEAESAEEAVVKLETLVKHRKLSGSKAITYRGVLSEAPEAVPACEAPWTPVIPAEAHSDDHACAVSFDAVPWFRSAAPQAIVDLAAIEWGGDYAADDVARFFEHECPDPEVGQLFWYLEKAHVGFECHVESAPALAWLAAHRPEVMALLKSEDLLEEEECPSTT